MPVRHKAAGKKLAREAKETEVAEANEGWQFVNIGQSGPDDRARLRKVVRANAMRHYRRCQKEKKAQEATETTPDASANSSLVWQTGDDMSPWLTGGEHTWPNEWDQVLDEARSTCHKLGSGNSDPFDALPVKGNAQACELLHNCKPSRTFYRLSIWPDLANFSL